MNYADEEFIKGRKDTKKEEYKTLDTGLFIKDRIVTFENKIFFDGNLQVMLPADFVDMPPNMAKLKYPSENRPAILKTSLDTSINFGFSRYQNALDNSQVEFVMNHFEMMSKKMNPANQFLGKGTKEVGAISIAWTEYRAFAIDGQIYNLIYFFPLCGKMCQGLFNCFFQDMPDWQSAAHLVMQTVTDLTKKRC